MHSVSSVCLVYNAGRWCGGVGQGRIYATVQSREYEALITSTSTSVFACERYFSSSSVPRVMFFYSNFEACRPVFSYTIKCTPSKYTNVPMLLMFSQCLCNGRRCPSLQPKNPYQPYLQGAQGGAFLFSVCQNNHGF